MLNALKVFTTVEVGVMVGLEFAVAFVLSRILNALPGDSAQLGHAHGGRMLGALMPFWYIGSLVLSAVWAIADWHHHGAGLVVTAAGLLVLSVIMSMLLLVPINNRNKMWTRRTAPPTGASSSTAGTGTTTPASPSSSRPSPCWPPPWPEWSSPARRGRLHGDRRAAGQLLQGSAGCAGPARGQLEVAFRQLLLDLIGEIPGRFAQRHDDAGRTAVRGLDPGRHAVAEPAAGHHQVNVVQHGLGTAPVNLVHAATLNHGGEVRDRRRTRTDHSLPVLAPGPRCRSLVRGLHDREHRAAGQLLERRALDHEAVGGEMQVPHVQGVQDVPRQVRVGLGQRDLDRVRLAGEHPLVQQHAVGEVCGVQGEFGLLEKRGTVHALTLTRGLGIRQRRRGGRHGGIHPDAAVRHARRPTMIPVRRAPPRPPRPRRGEPSASLLAES